MDLGQLKDFLVKIIGSDGQSLVRSGDDLTGGSPTPSAHASEHTDGTDDIQNATSGQKGLATAAQITKLDGIEAGAEVNNISDANATDLTDGGQTTLHSHAGTSGGNCYVEVGSYTGDGTTSKVVSLSDNAIIPQMVLICITPDGGTTEYVDMKINDSWGTESVYWRTEAFMTDNKVIAMATGSFTVDDDGSDDRPNRNGEEYTYIVWGTKS